MDKIEIEKYKSMLKEIQEKITDDDVKSMSPEDKKEYAILVAQIKARLEILENL